MKPVPHKWQFKPRFRRHAFGWRSQPAVLRVREAVAEIKAVARNDPVLAADGAVAFLERVSPALEHVDSSSGAIGSAVNAAIDDLVPIIAGAPADGKTRDAWLDRLFEAIQNDSIPYIELLADHWGELCASEARAASWADQLVGITRMALSPDRSLRGHFAGTTACLSALLRAGRHDELIDIVRSERFWPYRRWAVLALMAQGKHAEALEHAEASRDAWASDISIDQVCEEILLSCGRVEEAYARYGVRAHRHGTHLATFRAVAKRYPHKAAGVILADLVAASPGEEGKWFAAAKSAGLYDEALALASRSPCDPKTLTRAARDHVAKRPEFAVGAGLLALHWLVLGYGYDVTAADVRAAYGFAMAAAERLGRADAVRQRAREIATAGAAHGHANFVRQALGQALGLP